MASQSHAEYVLRFSNVLDGTHFIGRCAAECYALFHVGACFAAWLLTPAVPRVGFFNLAESCLHQKIFQVGGGGGR